MCSTIQHLSKFWRLNHSPNAVGVEGGDVDQIRFSPEVVHHHVGGSMAIDDQPVA
jgi:hypothetical protein